MMRPLALQNGNEGRIAAILARYGLTAAGGDSAPTLDATGIWAQKLGLQDPGGFAARANTGQLTRDDIARIGQTSSVAPQIDASGRVTNAVDFWSDAVTRAQHGESGSGGILGMKELSTGIPLIDSVLGNFATGNVAGQTGYNAATGGDVKQGVALDVAGLATGAGLSQALPSLGLSTVAPTVAAGAPPSVAGSVLADFAAPASVDAINAATPGTITMGVPASEITGSALVPAGAAAAGAAAGAGGAATTGAAGTVGGAAAGTAAADAAAGAAGGAAANSMFGDIAKTLGTTLGIGGLLNAGASLVGADMQANAAKDAAKIQADATKAGIAEQGRQYDTTRSDLAPYRAAGATALTNLGAGVGSDGTNGPLTRKFTMDDFWKDPVVQAGYQSGLDLGTKALRNAAPLTTGIDSGAAMKELTKFGTDYTGNMAAGSQARFVGDQGNQFNKEAALAGIGQTATNTVANAGTNAANNTSSMLTAQGNAGAAARIGGANAWSGALNNISNWWQSQALLDRLQNMPRSVMSGVSNWANPTYTGYGAQGDYQYG